MSSPPPVTSELKDTAEVYLQLDTLIRQLDANLLELQQEDDECAEIVNDKEVVDKKKKRRIATEVECIRQRRWRTIKFIDEVIDCGDDDKEDDPFAPPYLKKIRVSSHVDEGEKEDE
jgi:hypothetical protein